MKLTVFLSAFFDWLFCLLSWIGAVAVFSYLSTAENTLFGIVNGYVLVAAVGCVIIYTVCGVYKSLWQHPALGSALRLAVASFLASAVVFFVLRMSMGHWPNLGLGVMAFYLLFTMSFGMRIYKKTFHTMILFFRRSFGERQWDIAETSVRTLLVGAGESASTFLLHTSQHGPRPREILGIVDNDTRKHGYVMHGVRVLGSDVLIPALVKRLDIAEIIIAVPSVSNDQLRRIIALIPIRRCKVRVLSGLSSDKASDMLREINIGDLLGRPENVPDAEMVGDWVKGKTVLITGGGGSIGGEICRQLMRYDVGKIVIFDISENNGFNVNDELSVHFGAVVRKKVFIRVGSVQDPGRLDEVFAEFKPHIVFHAAAYKHVHLMEINPRLALENNTFGTFLTARTACRHNAERFVMISTDKAVNPTSVMGATKRLAEILVLGLSAHNCPVDLCNHQEKPATPIEFVCVRFGNVLESNGSVIPTFKRQIAAGGPVTLTHPEIERYFMTITEAAQLVLEAGAMAKGGEIFILNMGEPVKIAVLAENLIRMAGLTPGVDINIEITGLRPGEKLYEELLMDEEGLTKTQNDKIFVVTPPHPADFNELVYFLASYDKCNSITDAETLELLKKLVPEYKA